MTDRNTQPITVPQTNKLPVSEILERVYQSLVEKGYNPVNQLVGYIMSGDPTYITSYGGARSMISKLERDEILDELVTTYIETMQSRY
ncbi:MAG: IreB family regulatory phosphoprotein [Lachnospiraceae bacterium]|nr:IreB family regulatory phosphoprotein [Candidatus Minthocola equi]